MTVRGTNVVDQIIQVLEQIAISNGFHTDAGQRVKRGRPESLTINKQDLPAISVSTRESQIVAVKPRALIKTRAVEVVGIVDAAERDYEPLLDAVDEDIALALAGLTALDSLPGATDITISGGEFLHPESGSNTAGVSHTVSISYSLTKHEG